MVQQKLWSGEEVQGSDQERANKKVNVQVVKVQMVKERAAKFTTDRIDCPRTAAEMLAEFLQGADREHFVVICLNNKNKVNAINMVSVGLLSSTLVHPREVFKPAILANAVAVVVGHNHPSGDPQPSREDIKVTTQLLEGGKLLGIEVLDHVIIGDDGAYTSMKEEGLM